MLYSLTKTSEEAWMTIVEDIRNAKTSIDCELYMVDIDDVGLYLINTLRQKSREGVKVRLLVDAVGSYTLYAATTLKAEMRADGIELSFFNHFIPWHPRALNLWYFRDHRRLIIIDRTIAYTGSVCFSKAMERWRETMIRIQVPEAITDMEQTFKRMWEVSERGVFLRRTKPKSREWTYLTNVPIPGKYHYYNAIRDLIKKSKNEIFFTTPYFVPNYLFFRAIYRAAKRGVKVHLLIPKVSNHYFVGYAGDFFKERLLKKGVKIYLYDKSMVHAKTAIFDDEACTVGTMNLDNISLRYNFESGLIIRNKECIAEMKHMFLADTYNIEPLTLTEWQNRPFKDKLMAYLTWPIQKLL